MLLITGHLAVITVLAVTVTSLLSPGWAPVSDAGSPSYTELDSASIVQLGEGSRFFLVVDAKGPIPRHPDEFIGQVSRFGYGLRSDTFGITYIVTIGVEDGRVWPWHINAGLASRSMEGTWCFSPQAGYPSFENATWSVPGGIVTTGDKMRITLSTGWQVDAVASLRSGGVCAAGLYGMQPMHEVELSE